MAEALAYKKLSEQDFNNSLSFNSQDPAFQNAMMQQSMQVIEGESKKSITKEKAKEMFIFIEEKKMETMASIKDSDMMGLDDQGIMMQRLIDHTKVFDYLYEKHGIEEADFVQTINEHNLIQDPEIKAMLQRNLAKHPELLAMGGMPAGGGAMP